MVQNKNEIKLEQMHSSDYFPLSRKIADDAGVLKTKIKEKHKKTMCVFDKLWYIIKESIRQGLVTSNLAYDICAQKSL